MSKIVEKEQAIALRRRGLSYREISRYVGVSMSTVSHWLAHERWSEQIKNDNMKRAGRENSKRISLLNKARGNQFKKLYAEAERSAETEFKHYRHTPLFIAGLMLYMSEGDNTESHLIRITNRNTHIHRIFIQFAIEYLGVSREKMRFWVLLYPDLEPLTCSRFWSKKLRIPISQFHKYQVIEGRGTKRTLHFGVGNTIIGGTVFKRKLMKWIELSLKEL